MAEATKASKGSRSGGDHGPAAAGPASAATPASSARVRKTAGGQAAAKAPAASTPTPSRAAAKRAAPRANVAVKAAKPAANAQPEAARAKPATANSPRVRRAGPESARSTTADPAGTAKARRSAPAKAEPTRAKAKPAAARTTPAGKETAEAPTATIAAAATLDAGTNAAKPANEGETAPAKKAAAAKKTAAKKAGAETEAAKTAAAKTAATKTAATESAAAEMAAVEMAAAETAAAEMAAVATARAATARAIAAGTAMARTARTMRTQTASKAETAHAAGSADTEAAIRHSEVADVGALTRPALRRSVVGAGTTTARPACAEWQAADVRPPAVAGTPVRDSPVTVRTAARPKRPAGMVIEGEVTEAARLVKLAPPATRLHWKRRRAVVLLFLVLAVVVFVVGQVVRADDTHEVPEPAPGLSVVPTVAARSVPPDTVDRVGGGGFTIAGGYGPVLGRAGRLRRFEVAVEKGLGLGNGGEFAAEVDRILGDSRSWTAGRQFRLQRVPRSVASEFTVYLASARTSERMCAAGDLRTRGFTSCRLPGQVIINRDRWEDAVPDYGAPLAVYRAYAINHEVGHQLGHGHEGCPGQGRPAPAMMQQTYGLRGCVANPWPYLGGKRYAGNPID